MRQIPWYFCFDFEPELKNKVYLEVGVVQQALIGTGFTSQK